MPITEDKLCYTPPYAVDQPLKEVTQFEKKEGDTSVEAEFSDFKQKRSRGRPKGSKNKKTLDREAQAAVADSTPKRGRGRPKGSKNKKTLEREAQAAVTAVGQNMNLC